MKELDIQVPKQYKGDLSFPLVIKPISGAQTRDIINKVKTSVY